MRQQSAIQVVVRGVAIGGKMPLICLPLMAEKREHLLQQTSELVAQKPDILEWRMDAYEGVEDVSHCLSALFELRKIMKNIPLICTCRIEIEGGARAIPRQQRLDLITAVIASGEVDLIDVELCNDEEFLATVKEQVRKTSCKLILSYHNFQQTPGEQYLVDKLLEGQKMGGDISKIAVMPNSYADVLTLLSATNRARNELVKIPMVTMAMGSMGRITRLAGGLFGSDITFAIGKQSSAPGQLPLPALRNGMALMYE